MKTADSIQMIYTPPKDVDLQTFSIYFKPQEANSCSFCCRDFDTGEIVYDLKKGTKYVIDYTIISWSKHYSAKIVLRNIHNGDEHIEYALVTGYDLESASRNASTYFHPLNRLDFDGKPFLEFARIHEIYENKKDYWGTSIE